jgi:hypothetical protein
MPQVTRGSVIGGSRERPEPASGFGRSGLLLGEYADLMANAERAVHEAAPNIPETVRARFEIADHLSDEAHKTIIEIARRAPAFNR